MVQEIWHTDLISKEEIAIVGVLGRSDSALEDFDQVLTTTDPLALPEAQLTLIAVSDDAIQEVAAKLNSQHGLLAHTSGAQSIKAIKNQRRGVCYPLQTFSKTREVNFEEIPFCIEAESEQDLELLQQFSSVLSNKVNKLNSKDRKYLHLAAVYVNNFVNQLYQTAHEILEEQELPFELLLPLISETAAKVQGNLPADIQTGPAKRQDKGIIKQHLKIQNADRQKLYKLLTKAIKQSQNR